MAIDAIGALADSSSGVPANAGIGQEDFLRILLAQLRFQDPLKPVDNQQFVAQLAQFSCAGNQSAAEREGRAAAQHGGRGPGGRAHRQDGRGAHRAGQHCRQRHCHVVPHRRAAPHVERQRHDTGRTSASRTSCSSDQEFSMFTSMSRRWPA